MNNTNNNNNIHELSNQYLPSDYRMKIEKAINKALNGTITDVHKELKKYIETYVYKSPYQSGGFEQIEYRRTGEFKKNGFGTTKSAYVPDNIRKTHNRQIGMVLLSNTTDSLSVYLSNKPMSSPTKNMLKLKDKGWYSHGGSFTKSWSGVDFRGGLANVLNYTRGTGFVQKPVRIGSYWDRFVVEMKKPATLTNKFSIQLNNFMK